MLLVILALACDSTPADFSVDAVLSGDVPTVIEVSWDSDRAVDSATIDVEGAWGEAWSVDATGGTATIWGLQANQDVDLTLHFDSEGEVVSSEVVTMTTGSLDNDLPQLTMEGDAARALDGGLLLTTTVTSPGGPVLVDGDGDIRWWRTISSQGQVARARLSADGQHILSMPVNVEGTDDTGLTRIALDGELVETVQVDGQHHDFVEHSDGTLAFLVYSELDTGGQTIVGDAIVEVSPDGTLTQVWDIWDDLDYDPAASAMPGSGWSHGNSLVFDEAAQAYTVGFLGLQGLAQVDRATGELLWLMGTADSDFVDASGDPEVFDGQHQFDFLDGTLLIFENGTSEQQASRAVELAVGHDAGLVEEVWSYWPETSLYTFSLGDVERLDSGDTLVDFSSSGTIHQVDDAGEVVWKLSADLGGAFGYMQLLGPAGDQ